MADNKPKKKKKKVGRPRKRGRKPLKRKSSKSKVLSPNSSKKGFGSALTYNKVRKLLWDNYKQDFASYKDFISSKVDENGNKIKGTSISSLVYAECKSQDCLDSDVLNIYEQLNQEKGEKPVLPSSFFIEPFYYWQLTSEDWWSSFPFEVWVYSPMLLKNPDSFLGYLGENRYVDEDGEEFGKKEYEDSLKKKDSKRKIRLIEGYKNRFKPFVDECNATQIKFPDKDNYVAFWRFIGNEENPNEVYWSEERKRWEIEIIICDSFGNRNDYGYDPEDSGGFLDVDLIPNKKEEPQKIEPITGLSDDDKKKINDADLEIKKIEAERSLLEQREKTAKEEKEKMKVQIELIKQYKELGLTNDEIKKLLGL
jgi:hypothetical protein